MERPIVLLWIQIISVLFLGVSLFILVAGAPIYLLAMAMGGWQNNASRLIHHAMLNYNNDNSSYSMDKTCKKQ